MEIRRYADDVFPGWVECALTDAHGRVWSFVEKVPIVTAENLNAESCYPRPGVFACHVVERQTVMGAPEVVIIDTEWPWHVKATTGDTRFDIRPEQLVEFDGWTK